MTVRPSTPNPLLTYSHGLAGTHLAIAVEALREAREANSSTDHFALVRRNGLALTTVMHGYSALEAALSYEGHLLFSDPQSHKYLKPADRKFPIEVMARSWPRALVPVDKLRFLAEYGNHQLPERMRAELLELSVLRNWIVHGIVFSVTLLVSPWETAPTEGANVFDVHDREDSIAWEARFPHLKFNSIDRLNHVDAWTSLRVVVDALVLLTVVGSAPIVITQSCAGKYRLLEVKGDTVSKDFLELAIGEGSAGDV